MELYLAAGHCGNARFGIVSGKIQRDEIVQEDGRLVSRPRDVATYFVPASTIADFIPATVHF